MIRYVANTTVPIAAILSARKAFTLPTSRHTYRFICPTLSVA